MLAREPAGDWHDKTTREALLVEVAIDAQRALRAVEHDPEVVADGAIDEAARPLREIIGQEFDTPEPLCDRLTRSAVSGALAAAPT